MERRLSAILAADVVGYSRLMAEDEDKTHHELTTHLRELIAPTIAANHGHIVNIAGDGLLAEFGSVVDAVTCAAQVQQSMEARNATVPDGEQIVFRMGLNVGDVVHDGDTIYGDSVNVACRLQALAEPGGVLVSGAVKEHLGNKLKVKFDDLGERKLKNIRQPTNIFRIQPESLGNLPAATPSGNDAFRYRFAVTGVKRRVLGGWSWQVLFQDRNKLLVATACLAIAVVVWNWMSPFGTIDGNRAPGATPSIAVLPFDNLDDDPRHESFADGMTNDIITDLSKFSNLFVIAANSTFRYKGKPTRPEEVGKELGVRYVLEGSVQWIENRLRINAQLIDATNAHHIWAERFDRPVSDLFSVQNEISREIAGVIGPVSRATGKLRQTELARIAGTPTSSLQAYDHYLRGMVHFEKFNRSENIKARDAFARSIAIDPGYAKAIAQTAWTHLNVAWFGWTDDPYLELATAEALGRLAVNADPAEADAHRSLGAVRLFQKRHDLAIPLFQKALSLNPNSADMIMHLGWALTYAGEPKEGLESMEQAIERNPFHPDWYLSNVALGHFVQRRYRAAIETLERRNSKSNHTHLMLAASFAKLGKTEEAASEMAAFTAAEPDYTVEIAETMQPFRRETDMQHLLNAIRIAGLPEKRQKPR